MTDFYVVYETKSNGIYSISATPFDSVPDGQAICVVEQHEAEPFIYGTKLMHDYFLRVENGRGTFKSRLTNIALAREVLPNNVVKDLDYRVNFFESFNIQFKVTNGIELSLDLDTLSEQQRNKFDSTITSSTEPVTAYVTEYQDATKLITKFTFNLYQLSKDKHIKIDIDVPSNISVWAKR